MNWARGLKRLWLFASLVAAACIGSIIWGEAERRCSRPSYYESAQDCGAVIWEGIWVGTVVSLGLSLAMFIVGAGIIWIVRGFQQKEPQA